MYINLGTGVGKEEKMNVPYAHKKVFFFSPQDFKARNQTLISLHSRDFVCQMRYLQKLLFFLFVFWDVLTMLLLAKIVHI